MSSQEDPIFKEIVALRERITRIEERTAFLNNLLDDLAHRVERMDRKIWAILSGVVLSILLQIMWRLIP